MYMGNNTLIMVVLIAAACLAVFFIFKKEVEPEAVELESPYALPYLCGQVKAMLNEIINQNLLELYISRSEMKKREQQKARISTAVRSCAQGNLGEKEFIKDYLKDLLQNRLGIDKGTIDAVIPFNDPLQLTAQDKFEILLQAYRLRHGLQAFGVFLKEQEIEFEKANENGLYYEVTEEDIHKAFGRFYGDLSYVLKLEVVVQRIFQLSYGYGCVDELIYQNAIDGISGGTSGITNDQYNFMEEIMGTADISGQKSFDSIWIIFNGKSVRLSFLGFGSPGELIRICKNLYRYDNIGHLTSSNGFKLSYLYNGSRVVVTRPKLTSGWAFFIRKFESSKAMGLAELLADESSDVVIELTKWMVKGLLNIVVSGDQGSGKTTFLKVMLQFMDQRYQIRTTEAEYELWLNNLYPELNVVPFRGTQEVSLMDAINIQKKTDGMVMILGEIADAQQANAYITLTQAGTKCTIGTVHTMSPEDTVDYFRNATLSKYGSFHNEMTAEEQVANAIHIDIHWEKTADGKRHISYIAEIIPSPRANINTGNRWDDIAESLRTLARRRAFTTREIITFEEGRYIFKNPLSKRSVARILKNLSQEDGMRFLLFNQMGGAS
ncbi:MAG TPA: Flp pilus assembly complex ATPase component TadA [Clostridiales bacterium]|nr:Flp pilus assembly complex ATPase component TadA [Clostridiales bacterium]